MSSVMNWKQFNLDQWRKMIDSGFDINSLDPREKHRILNNAIEEKRDLDLVDFLLNIITDIDYNKLLQTASRNNNRDCLKLLLRYVDHDHQNDDGYTALHIAVFHGCIDCVRILLAQNSEGRIFTDINSYNKRQQETPLYSAMFGIINLEIISLLLEHGADPNIKHQFGDTSLHVARNSDIITLLMRYGADINHVNDSGATALYRAVNWQSLKLVKCLLEHGADPNITKKDGSTSPLKFAIFYRNYDIIQLLLDYRASFEEIQTTDPKILELFDDHRIDISVCVSKEPQC